MAGDTHTRALVPGAGLGSLGGPGQATGMHLPEMGASGVFWCVSRTQPVVCPRHFLEMEGWAGCMLGLGSTVGRKSQWCPSVSPSGSWVELHFSNNGNGSSVPASVSIYNGDLEKILLDAQHESGRSSSKSSHCDSPPRSQTPQDTNRASEMDTHSIGEKNSSQSEEDYIERRKEVESILKKNSDWIWDWSSRPENIPPKELLFKHPKRAATLSMRNTSVMKKGGIFSAEFLKVFLPSLLLSHLLAIGLGIYIGRRLTTSTSTF
uniref:BCL2 interacting protein 3 n=2 Tax=Ursus TaxID=9639 RepID=A0A452R042_URSAM